MKKCRIARKSDIELELEKKMYSDEQKRATVKATTAWLNIALLCHSLENMW